MTKQSMTSPSNEEVAKATLPQANRGWTGNERGPPPATSLEAFDSLDHEKNETIRKAIVKEVLDHGPDTSLYLAHRLKLPEDSVWKRCSELLQAGLLRRDGRKQNPSGRQAAMLAAGCNAEEWLAGIIDVQALRRVTVQERRAKVIKAAAAVVREGKPKDGFVVVPMELMVDLSVALTRFHGERLERIEEAARHG